MTTARPTTLPEPPPILPPHEGQEGGCLNLGLLHQQKKWFAPCASGRTGRTGRMEVETLDHDESPKVTSFRAITYLHAYFSMLTPYEVPSRLGEESADVKGTKPGLFLLQDTTQII